LRTQGKIPKVKTIILMDDDTPNQTLDALKQAGFGVVMFNHILNKDSEDLIGGFTTQESVVADEPVSPMNSLMTDVDVEHNADSIYTICFTSSSTGQPKGAILSNRNVLANTKCFHLFDANFEV